MSDCLRPFPGSFALASGELGGDLENLCDSFVVFDSFCSSKLELDAFFEASVAREEVWLVFFGSTGELGAEDSELDDDEDEDSEAGILLPVSFFFFSVEFLGYL